MPIMLVSLSYIVRARCLQLSTHLPYTLPFLNIFNHRPFTTLIREQDVCSYLWIATVQVLPQTDDIFRSFIMGIFLYPLLSRRLITSHLSYKPPTRDNCRHLAQFIHHLPLINLFSYPFHLFSKIPFLHFQYLSKMPAVIPLSFCNFSFPSVCPLCLFSDASLNTFNFLSFIILLEQDVCSYQLIQCIPYYFFNFFIATIF